MQKKYQKFVLFFLSSIAIFFNASLFDLVVLPKQKVSDFIVSKREITTNSKNKNIYYGCEFKTEKGFTFILEEYYINENQIEITHTTLFQNITNVTSPKEDFSERLASDINGVYQYFYFILAISSVISIVVLLLNKNLNDNSFQNVILFNAMILVFIGILLINTH